MEAVIGYSVNDTVVVFDRVREIWATARKVPFRRVVNRALLQTVPRTVNTGMGAIFILGALAVLGGDSLTDFAVALLIGIAVGTYSSMFTASPLAIELQTRGKAPAGRPTSQPATRASSTRGRPPPADHARRRGPRETGARGSRTP